MILRDNQEVEVTNDIDDKKIPPLEDDSDDKVEYPFQGESIEVRRALGVQVKEDDLQRKKFIQDAILVIRCVI